MARIPNDGEPDILLGLGRKADPRHCALVVIDVQNDFVADGGFFANLGADVGPIQTSVVPQLQKLIAAARRADVFVVFVQAIYDEEYLSAPMRERNIRVGATMPRCITGTWGADFYAVKPEPGEPVVVKHCYSAVLNTSLIDLLRERGISSLLLAGVATDTCVESTGRDAYFLDHYVTLVSDCCGAFSEQDHLGALARFRRDYGEVVASADVIAVWQESGPQSGVSLGSASAQPVSASATI